MMNESQTRTRIISVIVRDLDGELRKLDLSLGLAGAGRVVKAITAAFDAGVIHGITEDFIPKEMFVKSDGDE